MLGTIIIREIQEYIKSKKFLIGMVITVVLVTVTTVINIEDYAKRRQDYLDAKREMSINKNTNERNVFRQPQVLSILVLGKDQKLGNRMKVALLSISAKTSGYSEGTYTNLQKDLYGSTVVDFHFDLTTAGVA